ncbi:hypothetical protein, partial [Rhizobium rhizoryzae]|uniref:hypothetical protein n=1 Tax=Rhizobium rhizoryzae TaxID=451876 RepID=UPI001AED8A13
DHQSLEKLSSQTQTFSRTKDFVASSAAALVSDTAYTNHPTKRQHLILQIRRKTNNSLKYKRNFPPAKTSHLKPRSPSRQNNQQSGQNSTLSTRCDPLCRSSSVWRRKNLNLPLPIND